MIVSRMVNFGVKFLKDIEYFFLKMFQLPENTETHSAERRKFILG